LVFLRFQSSGKLTITPIIILIKKRFANYWINMQQKSLRNQSPMKMMKEYFEVNVLYSLSVKKKGK